MWIEYYIRYLVLSTYTFLSKNKGLQGDFVPSTTNSTYVKII